MTQVLSDVQVPTAGSPLAPRYTGGGLDDEAGVDAQRSFVPSAREQDLGVGHRYVEAVHEKPPEAPSFWSLTRQFLREASPAEITRHGPKFPLYWTAAATAIGAFDLTAVLGPEIYQNIGLSLVLLGIYSSLIGTAGQLCSPLFGYLADRMKRVLLLKIAWLISAPIGILYAFAPTPGTFMLGNLLSSVAGWVQGPANNTLNPDWYPPEVRVRQIAFINLVGVSFGIIGSPVGGYIGQQMGWRTALLVQGVITLLVALGVFFLKEPIRGYWDRKAMGATEEQARRPQPPVSLAEAWRAAYSIKTLRRIWLTYPIAALGAGAGLQYFYFYGVWHLTPSARGLVAAVGLLPQIPALIIGSVYGDRLLKSRPGLILTYGGLLSIVSALGAIVLVLSPYLWLSILLGFVFAIPTTAIGIANTVMFQTIVPARFRASGNTAQLPFSLLGASIGAAVTTWALTSNISFKLIILGSIPFSVVAALVYMSAAPFVESDMRRSLAASMAEEESERARKSGANKLLICRDVDVTYGGTQVVFGVDFDVEEGEIVALLGTNGSGKSTLLKAIAGIEQASNGVIFFDGVDITHKPPYEQSWQGIIMVPGGRAIFPTLTVSQNLSAAAWMYRKDPAYLKERLGEVLALFPVLSERFKQQAGNLSGGEQQMLCLAQTFLMKPRLLMIDELTLGLAPQVVDVLLDAVRKINAQGTTVILVEQSINLAVTIANRAVFLEKGTVRYDGPTTELLQHPEIAHSVFLGGARTTTNLGATRTRTAIRSLDEEHQHLLKVDDVRVQFGGVDALRGVSLEMAQAEIVGLIGANGAGKTTLFDVISGFITPPQLTGGTIALLDRDITHLPADARHHAGLCRSFQNVSLFSGMTARDNIAVAFERHLDATNPVAAALWLPNIRRSEKRTMRRVDNLVESLGLGAFANKFMDELSTGTRRLVEIACLLAAGPQLLLLDEPSSGLAQAETEELGPVILRLRQEARCGILLIEHDLPLVSTVSDRMVAMDLGEVLTIGTPGEVMSDQRVIDAYLGASQEALMRSGQVAERRPPG